MILKYSWRLVAGLVLAVGLMFLAGCAGSGDGPARYTVRGTVTFDGEPVEDGQVIFLPEDGKGRPDAGKVTNGAFEFRVTGGKKRVEITASRKTGETYDEDLGETMPVLEEFIPARYNTESELTVEVEPNSENTYEFDLTS